MDYEPHMIAGEMRPRSLAGRSRSLRASRGFSIIEMIIIIGIIVLLTALGIRVGAAFKSRAMVARTRGILSQCEAVATAYQVQTGNVINLWPLNTNTYNITWGGSAPPYPAPALTLGPPFPTNTYINNFVWAAKRQAAVQPLLRALGGGASEYTSNNIAYSESANEIRDSWNHLLDYYPSSSNGAGPYPDHPTPFFVSAGLDGKLGNIGGSAAEKQAAADNLYSYDVK